MTNFMQSDVNLIKTVLLKHPRQAFISDQKIDDEWQPLNYLSRPDLEEAILEYNAFVELIKSHGAEVHFLAGDENTQIDSLYVRGALLVSDKGVILAKMGKPERRTEPSAMKQKLIELGIPILGQIGGNAKVEGGDVAWLGYAIDEMVVVPLPHFKGPTDAFHLMSIFSPISNKAAVVYSPLMPVIFRVLLLKRGSQLIEVPDEEYDSLGCNVLAIAPGKCIMAKGNPITRQRIIAAGYEVYEYDGNEISLKGCGGPTCLTRPLFREK